MLQKIYPDSYVNEMIDILRKEKELEINFNAAGATSSMVRRANERRYRAGVLLSVF